MSEPTYEKLRPGEAGYNTDPAFCQAIDHNENVVRLSNGRLALVGGPHSGCSNPQCFKHKGGPHA